MKDRIVLSKRILLFYVLGLGLLLFPAVQTAENIILTINQVDDSAYPQVEVFVSVSDQQGVPIEGLTPDAFQLSIEGSPTDNFDISAVDDTGQGISVILVVDTSGSMAAQNEAGISNLSLAREAILLLVDSLDETRDQVALIDFNSEVVLRQPLSSDFAGLTMALNELIADQNTRLNDAAFEAAVLAANSPPGRKAVVLLTDGQDTESRLLLDDAIDKAQESDVPFYTVALGTEFDSDPLERLALLTGGRYLASPSVDDLEASFETIASQLRQQYVLTFEADVPADGRRHEFSLNATHEGSIDDDGRSFVARLGEGSVTIVTPESGQEIAGSTIISPTFQMPGQVAQVTFNVNGGLVETRLNPPFIFDWDSSTVEVGSHTIGLTVRDHVGNQAQTTTTVVVVPLLEAAFIAPIESQDVGETVLLEVVVDDSFFDVQRVEFSVNDSIIDTVQAPPFETELDTADFEPGSYIILATVYDEQGNQQQISSEITLNEPLAPTPRPTATASATRPASRPQPEAAENNRGALAEIFRSPILYIILGIGLLGLFAILIAFIIWQRRRNASQTAEKSYHDEIVDFERRVIQEAKAHGKVPPVSPPVAETQVTKAAKKRKITPPPPPKQNLSPDEVNATQMLPRSPLKDSEFVESLQKQAYFLVTQAGMDKAHWYPLKEDGIIIGRAKDSDITLIDGAVSRHHSTVQYENGQYTYKDLEPTNPSIINGKIYKHPILVEDGDEIVVGESKLVFKRSI